jgi:hypothetical protein
MPDSKTDRVGEQVGSTWKLLSCRPSFARASSAGVAISPPYAPMSEYPMSSATMSRMFGRLASSVLEVGLQLGKDDVAMATRTMAVTDVGGRRAVRVNRVMTISAD